MQHDWHPEDIKAAVRKKGVTLAEIGRAIGLGRSAIALALTLPRSQAERAIADVLGVHPKIIWPSRYHSNGRRKRPQPTGNYRATARFGKGDPSSASQIEARAS